MDPYIANLNFDPPRRSAELAWGLLPALLVNAAFFGVVLLGAQPGDLDPGKDNALSLTREMGGPPATTPAAAPATSPPTTTPAPDAKVEPAAPVKQVPAMDAGRQPATPTVVARAEPQAGSTAAPRPAAARVSPSFDCNRARLRTDKLICSDAELSQLDRDLGRLYAQARSASPDPAAFRRASDREWARREAECKDADKDCLRRWYAERRAQLQASLEGRRQATGSPTR